MRINPSPSNADSNKPRSNTTRVSRSPPRACEANPVVPMRRKLNEKYRNMKKLLPSATAAR